MIRGIAIAALNRGLDVIDDRTPANKLHTGTAFVAAAALDHSGVGNENRTARTANARAAISLNSVAAIVGDAAITPCATPDETVIGYAAAFDEFYARATVTAVAAVGGRGWRYEWTETRRAACAAAVAAFSSLERRIIYKRTGVCQ
ncbi:hypothetical protein [Pollutimonas bauzanensis]|uniref:hypothetical protein n=1 Tax=Pollutimonas bauzanensis TaxID=658167 RepID=UPI0009340523|nr:hypothetical protein [Pollutimonas bauzanensis]